MNEFFDFIDKIVDTIKWIKQSIYIFVINSLETFFVSISVLSTGFFASMYLSDDVGFLVFYMGLVDYSAGHVAFFSVVGLCVGAIFQTIRTRMQLAGMGSLIKEKIKSEKETIELNLTFSTYFNFAVSLIWTGILIIIIFWQSSQIYAKVAEQNNKIVLSKYYNNIQVQKNNIWINSHKGKKWKTKRAGKRIQNLKIKKRIKASQALITKSQSNRLLWMACLIEFLAVIIFWVDVSSLVTGNSTIRIAISKKYRKLMKIKMNTAEIPKLPWWKDAKQKKGEDAPKALPYQNKRYNNEYN